MSVTEPARICSRHGCESRGEIAVRHPKHGRRVVCRDHGENFAEVIDHVE